MEKIDNFINISQQINNLVDKELKDYIVDRLLWLEKNTKIEFLGFIDNEVKVKVYYGYISSNSPIKSSKSAEAFYLDNINIYYDFIVKYKEHINEHDL